MQRLQYDLRCPAAKESSITHAAVAPSNLGAATTMRSAHTELRNTKNYAQQTASEIAAPKPDLAQSTSQYYFVLQSLHPVLLCTTKLAQSTSQYYFVLRSLHKESFYTHQVLSQRSFYTQQAF